MTEWQILDVGLATWFCVPGAFLLSLESFLASLTPNLCQHPRQSLQYSKKVTKHTTKSDVRAGKLHFLKTTTFFPSLKVNS